MHIPEEGHGSGRPNPALRAGLCDSCAWQRVIVSGRGSAFSLCRRSVEDARFPKYPPVPVLACAGYERGSSPDEASPDPGSSLR
jgi:hypothetical protein